MPVSVTCSQCEDKYDMGSIICDKCLKNVCGKCSGLNATEIRVIELKKRTLKYFCPPCDASIMKPTQLPPNHQQSFDEEQKTLNSFINNQLLQLENALKSEIEYAKTQILSNFQVVTDTNRDMIKLLSSQSTSDITTQAQSTLNKKLKANLTEPVLKSTTKFEYLSRSVQRDATHNHEDHIQVTQINPPLRTENQRKRHVPQPQNTSNIMNNVPQKIQQTTLRPRIIRGSAKADISSSFTAATRRVWLSVGKVGDTTKEEIKTYLENKFEGHSFLVEPLPKNETAASCAYKIGADMDLIDDLYKADTWPSGVIVQRFNFRRFRRHLTHQ